MSIESTIQVIAQLRDPEKGCPWDLKQTHQTLLPYLIEESYEFIHSVHENNWDEMKDELGDVLLQVLLHSQLASEKNKFNFDDVAKNLEEKIIRRHPHVFTDKTGKNTNMEQIKKTWEEIKKEEKKNNPQKEKNPLNQLNRGPSLLSAHKIGEKSKKLDFDWDTTREVFNKCQEEFQELETALKENNFQNHSDVQEELGDLLFSLAQLSRHLGNNGETLLTKANQKFLDRFDKMNQTSFEKFQKEFSQLSREEKEKLWDYIKHAK